MKDLNSSKRPSDVIGADRVGEFGAFKQRNHDQLQEVTRELIKDYCLKNSFNKEQFEAFKSGVVSWSLFLEKCIEESEKVKKEE